MNEINFNDECFNILNIAQMCGIEYSSKPTSRGKFLAKCPFCESSKKKMSLAVETSNGYTNVYRCAKCGSHGTSTELYAKAKNISTKQAMQELLGGEISVNAEIKKQVIESMNMPTCLETADIDKLNSVYTAFLNKLRLTRNSYDNLKGRGLSDGFIQEKGYKSIPIDYKENSKICKELINEGYSLHGVAGFYVNSIGHWSFSSIQGYLIPIRDLNGRIVSLQLRRDEAIDGKRYTYFSSSRKETGARAIAAPHVVIGSDIENVYITEGPLKGDIASMITGKTFLAVPGVTTGIDILMSYLDKLKVKKVTLAFDMDFKSNIDVRKALINLGRLIESKGVDLEIELWNPQYKGIDDYLIATR